MTAFNRSFLFSLRLLLDVIALLGSWILSYYIRFYANIFAISKGIPSFSPYLKLTPFIAIIWISAFYYSGFYKRSMHRRSAVVEALDLIQSSIFAIVCFTAFTYFYNEFRYSRGVLILFFFLHIPGIIILRSLLRKIFRKYRKNAAPKKLLVVGSGDCFARAISLPKYNEIEAETEVDAILIGRTDEITHALSLCKSFKINSLSTPNNWKEFILGKKYDSVVIALPYQSYSYLDIILSNINDQVTDIKILPDVFKFIRFNTNIEIIGKTPIISVHESPLIGYRQIIKRSVDISGSLLAICLFSPIMLLVACLVKLSSNGPILYRQKRMGLDGQIFEILKFRSMPINSEKETGAVWAQKEDQRATIVGRFLRKSSLDELPQLFNVLRGDMSLVGPRPERPVFVNQFRQDIPGYMLRHKVKAGITGWAQINGWRGNTSIEKRIQCDLYYIQNWSFWFDIKILFLTIFRGFIHPNAY